MYYYETLVGIKFNMLLVKSQADKKNGHVCWECLCDCGNTKIVRGDCLKQGVTKSCGCLLKAANKVRYEKTGFCPTNKTHGMSRTSIYNIYNGMLRRCYDKNATSYKYYGGIGVTVCARWLDSFENFYEDMGNRPSKDFSLERVVGEIGYQPGNVVWADKYQQGRNKAMMANNKSGINGVCRHHNHGYEYWLCFTTNPSTNVRERKAFSILKLGDEEAFKQACEYRNQKILEYNLTHGAGYSELHGLTQHVF